ncbi:hypothetical protein DFP72DRAFT_907148, partial [Ephemerocybe angulata]
RRSGSIRRVLELEGGREYKMEDAPRLYPSSPSLLHFSFPHLSISAFVSLPPQYISPSSLPSALRLRCCLLRFGAVVVAHSELAGSMIARARRKPSLRRRTLACSLITTSPLGLFSDLGCSAALPHIARPLPSLRALSFHVHPRHHFPSSTFIARRRWRGLRRRRVLQDTGISNKAAAIRNSFVNDIFERIALTRLPNRPSLSRLGIGGLFHRSRSREIRTAVRLILLGNRP